MSFNKNIPQPTDRLAKSQQDLLSNNLQLNTSFGINHYPFDDVTSNNGKHTYVQLVNRLLIPPMLSAGEDTLYTKATTGQGELYFTRDNSGVEVQMTNLNPFPYTNNYTPESGGGPVGLAFSAGTSFIAGGLLVQYGIVAPATDGIIVKYPYNFKSNGVDTLAYSIQLTFAELVGAASVVSVGSGAGTTNKQFILRMAIATSARVFWIAIGPRT